MDEKEFRLLIKYGLLNGKNTVESKTWLDTEFPDATPGTSTIKDGYIKFRCGEMRTEDGECSGRPKEVFNAENILKIHKIILNDCKLKLKEIRYQLNVYIVSFTNIWV
ncbi:hypothetical protein GWI33_008521 [Rhynchophorus ferrugineus]|uniref:Uncharacterized protein n=1 Tax=Rhynchophorus ferrugineus TaxID=354439 RepID=A0A834IEA9_RHYFE|nr:hypothetical protein GWI33_008521 [Rhynchophorus ferrugineus]